MTKIKEEIGKIIIQRIGVTVDDEKNVRLYTDYVIDDLLKLFRSWALELKGEDICTSYSGVRPAKDSELRGYESGWNDRGKDFEKRIEEATGREDSGFNTKDDEIHALRHNLGVCQEKLKRIEEAK